MLTLDLLGIVVFAVSGGLLAVRNQLDIVGVVVLAMVTGLGGGVIRDVIIGADPAAFADWRYLLAPAVAGLVTFLWHPAVGRFERSINVFDAFGLGLFAVAGAVKAYDAGLGLLASAVLGAVTAVGGGVLRDVLAGRVPVVLRDGELYAIPAIAGAGVAVLGKEFDLDPLVVTLTGAGLTIGWRLLALRRGWTAPRPSPPNASPPAP
ncbi:trimeric intracellular cation channel family protein [Nocardioides sp. zg-ZUI104]|nr:trimeric intracellular cation channel family protein [Nocardioides faecalis]